MSLLTDASLLLTPNANATSKLYSIIPSNGNGDFTGTRATTATRVNSSGLIETTAINMIRRDYSLGGCPNILLEPQRTNLALQSSSFDSVSWIKSSAIVTANSTTSPSGVLDADTITTSATFNNVFQGVSVLANTTYTFSFWALRGTMTDLKYSVYNVSGTSNIIAPTSYYSQTNSSTWSRVVVTFTTPVGCTLINIYPIRDTGVTGTCFLWGAQLEAGAYATSYIPTTTASVTRNFDYIIRNNLVTNGIVSATQGTWFLEIRNNLPFLRDNSTSSLNFGMDGNNCIRFRSTGSGRISVEKNVGGVLTVLASGLSTTQTMKIAFKWNGSEVETFMNGVKQTPANKTYPSTIIPQTVTTNFTNTNFGVPMTINEMAFFPNQLTDSQLIALTT